MEISYMVISQRES